MEAERRIELQANEGDRMVVEVLGRYCWKDNTERTGIRRWVVGSGMGISGKRVT